MFCFLHFLLCVKIWGACVFDVPQGTFASAKRKKAGMQDWCIFRLDFRIHKSSIRSKWTPALSIYLYMLDLRLGMVYNYYRTSCHQTPITFIRSVWQQVLTCMNSLVSNLSLLTCYSSMMVPIFLFVKYDTVNISFLDSRQLLFTLQLNQIQWTSIIVSFAFCQNLPLLLVIRWFFFSNDMSVSLLLFSCP